MTIEFRCPTCEKLLKTSDDKAGATAKCPQCGSAVIVPTVEQPVFTDVDPAPTWNDFADGATESAEHQATQDFARDVACPMCGATNDAGASRCYACGEELQNVSPAGRSSPQGRTLGAVWQSAWDKWTANLGICVAAAAIGGGMFLAVYIVFIVMIIAFSVGMVAVAQNPGAEIAAVIAIVGSGYLLMLLTYAYLLSGFSNFALRLNRNRDVRIGAIFPPMTQVFRSIVCTFLIMLGLLVTMLPGAVMYGVGFAVMEGNNPLGLILAPVGYFLMLAG